MTNALCARTIGPREIILPEVWRALEGDSASGDVVEKHSVRAV